MEEQKIHFIRDDDGFCYHGSDDCPLCEDLEDLIEKHQKEE